ncbi:MAG: mechanosensitive ion channel protein MscS, partial [Nodosilinea sp.]
MPVAVPLHRWLARIVWGLVLTLMLHGSGGGPALAQSLDAEPVFLDGLFLFDFPAAGDLTAAERAVTIEINLEPLVNSPETVLVRSETRQLENSSGEDQSSNPVIFASDRYIMTVTNADVQAGGADTAQAQADQWVSAINTALDQARSDRQEGFLAKAVAQALTALATALALNWLAGRLWRRWLRPFLDRFALSPIDPGDPEHEASGLDLFFRFTLFLGRCGVWATALVYIANLFPLTRRLDSRVMLSLRVGLFDRSLELGERSYSLLGLLLLVAVLLAMLIVASALTNVMRTRVLRATGLSLAAQEAIAVIAKYTLILIGTVVILQLWGIDLSSIALIA